MEIKTQGRGGAANRCPSHSGSHRRARRCALGLAVIAIAACGPSAFAEIYDDFNDATRSATLWTNWPWNGTGSATVTNGHVTLDFTAPANQYGFYNLVSYRTWTLREGRTLEFRVDLLGCNADGAVAYFGFHLNDGFSGYNILVDPDTIGLLKRNTPQLFFVTNGPTIDVSNVKLVVSMTGVTNSVHLKFRILDNNNAGAEIFKRDYWDTPAVDPMQVGVDNPPGSYLGATGSFVACLAKDTGNIDPDVPPLTTAEVVFDNAEVFEYDMPHAEITRSVLLSWTANTEEEQIVVGAGSPAGPVWTPWPEPIFKRFGELSMAVPITKSEQYFKLVPGTQFIDAFGPVPDWPYATRTNWTPYFYGSYSSLFQFAVTNGTYRIVTTGPSSDGRVILLPPGPDVVVRDFTGSVDLLAGPDISVGIAIGARAWRDTPFPGNSNGYIGSFVRNPPGHIGKGELGIWNGSVRYTGGYFNLDSAADYRLQFSAVGTVLSLKLFNVAKPSVLVSQFSIIDSNFSQGLVALWAEPTERQTIILDNFFVTGTKP